ncbi:Hypothetical predicted protein [Olea europaea subsp. europaea]|uniref:Uncharacterized protein n=1 Tax=Olea europaea subsp. europaea TaxID=158383 RepID=A0A8S0TJX3_OLEEU|nr:Hypothetical predicted protein [Olea europaea subsp. europaea]
MTRTQQRHFQRNYGRMMRQQQGMPRPKTPKLLEVANQNVLKDSEETGTDESIEELLETSFGRSKFEQDRRDGEDLDQLLTIQFGTLPPIVANNYLLANEFKNKEKEKEERKDNEEEACVLECEEGQTSRGAYDDEGDDGMMDIEEEIDLEAERRKREILHNILLKQLHREGVREVDLLGKPSGRSFDYYVLYGTPKGKRDFLALKSMDHLPE